MQPGFVGSLSVSLGGSVSVSLRWFLPLYSSILLSLSPSPYSLSAQQQLTMTLSDS